MQNIKDCYMDIRNAQFTNVELKSINSQTKNFVT